MVDFLRIRKKCVQPVVNDTEQIAARSLHALKDETADVIQFTTKKMNLNKAINVDSFEKASFELGDKDYLEVIHGEEKYHLRKQFKNYYTLSYFKDKNSPYDYWNVTIKKTNLLSSLFKPKYVASTKSVRADHAMVNESVNIFLEKFLSKDAVINKVNQLNSKIFDLKYGIQYPIFFGGNLCTLQ